MGTAGAPPKSKLKRPPAKKKAETFEFSAIGYVRSPFKTKFAVPRQPGLVSDAVGVIKIHDDPNLKTALRSLSEFSHLWILFIFHEHGAKDWKPSIRPPRLGGSQKVGVLASRSPHRPNPIGMSAVAITKIDLEAEGGAEITVSGIDLIEGTPVVDIKPYIPYADSIPTANAGWASAEIPRFKVSFTETAEQQITDTDPIGEIRLRNLIISVLELDPRPAYQQTKFPLGQPKTWGKAYGFDLLGFDIQYEINDGQFHVTHILFRSATSSGV